MGTNDNAQSERRYAFGPAGRRAYRLVTGTKEATNTNVMLTVAHGQKKQNVGDDANALVVLRRLAFTCESHERKTDIAVLHHWAARHAMGQKAPLRPVETTTPTPTTKKTKKKESARTLLDHVNERRDALITRWTTVGSRTATTLRLCIDWRMTTGLGVHTGILDSGIAMHGTYGWPIIPSSTVKGLARAAVDPSATPNAERVFGGANSGDDGGTGTVTFLDALPLTPVTVHDDVITPHQQPYYAHAMKSDRKATAPPPPGEHHNPVPASFLSISGTFRVDLLGTDADDLAFVTQLLTTAGDELGVGGRTTAGYGYFSCLPSANPIHRSPSGGRQR